LQSLALLGINLVDTLDANDECKLGLSRNVKGTILLGYTSKTNAFDLCLTVFLDVLFGTLEDDSTLLLVGLENLMSASHSRESYCIRCRVMTPQSRKMVNKATALAESLVERIGILVIITSVIDPLQDLGAKI
jgi:hypothetical protein